MKNKNKHYKKTIKKSNFQIHIQNSSNKTINLNIGSKIGKVYKISDDIKNS